MVRALDKADAMLTLSSGL